MISALSMPWRYTDVIPRLACPSWALDDVERHAFAGHLDGVRVPQLMRGEAPAHAGLGGQPAQRVTRRGA